MLMMLLIGLLQIGGPTNNSLVEQSKAQAKYYISNIENDSNIDANIWALTTLATENAEIRSYIEKEVKSNDYKSKYLKLFKTIEPNYKDQLRKFIFKKGSSTLLIDLLFVTKEKKEREKIYHQFLSQFSHDNIKGIDFDALCKSIIEEKTITNEELDNESFRIPHFFLLYRNYKLVPNKYLNQVMKNWNIEEGLDLMSSLSLASYLRILYLKYSYEKTTPFYNKLIKDAKFPNSYLKLRVYRYLDYSMYQSGYYDRSLKILREFTLPLSEYLNRKQLELSFKELQGVYLYHIGKIQLAEKKYREVLAEVNKNNLEKNLSSLYNNLALTYYKLGKYDQYLDLQFQALEIAKSSNNYSHQLEIYKNLFLYFKSNNDRDNALNNLLKAQKIAQNYDNPNDLGNIYTFLGIFYREFDKDFYKSLNFFSKAEKFLDGGNNVSDFVNLLREHSQTLEKQQNYLKALSKYDQIINLAPQKKSPFYIDALVNKALIFLKMGDIYVAKKFIKKFKSYDLSKLDFQQIIKAKTVEADYLSRINKTQKALNILEPALNQVLVRAKSSTDLKSGFWHVVDEYLDAFELAVSIYIQNGQPEKAIEKLDQLKTINDASFYQNPLVKSSLLNESELTQYKRLTNQLDATRKKLLTAPKEQQFDIQQTISQLKLKKRKLDRKLTKDVESDPISIREVQNKLSAHELVMHITELNDQYYVAKITRSDVTIDTIPLDSKLRNLLSSSAQQIATHHTNLDSLYKISQLLGMGEIPNRIEKITLIPDSYFYQLPIDVLPLEKPDHSYSYGEVKYVIENFRTQYLTSLNDFQRPSESESSSRNRLNFAGYGISNFSGYNKKSLVPLPFAQTEVTSIANELSHLSLVKTYINEESTKSTFTKTAPNAQIIHLATHSEVSERDPMFSTVYLSKTTNSADSTFDNQIFAYELFELNLSNEMIMLNSCESGSGSYIQGTGVMGISRALQYAGAKSLILNLWSVNDMLASDFAIHFYDQLNQGKSKAEALRNTKRYFLRTKNASPHFWGPYMLIGNTNPIVKPDEDKNLAMASTFILYFLITVGLSYLAQQGIIFKEENALSA